MLFSYLRAHKIGIATVEHALLIVCVLWSHISSGTDALPVAPSAGQMLKATIVALTFQMSLHLTEFYGLGAAASVLLTARRLAYAILLGGLWSAGVFVVTPSMVPVQGDATAILVRTAAFLVVWHVLLKIYFSTRSNYTDIIIVGTGKLARAVAAEILERKDLGLRINGFTDDDPALQGVSIINPSVVGLTRELRQVVAQRKPDLVVVELEERRGTLPTNHLLELKMQGIMIDEAATFYERLTGKIAIESLKPSSMIFSDGFRISPRRELTHRVLSLVVAVPLLLLFLPVFPLVALALKLDSQGTVFFGQERVGKHGREFTLWKFRSMRSDAERVSGPVWAVHKDDRITRVGQYLRRTRLDEFPQLLNVIKGDMNLVGPRPERPYFVKQLSAEIPYYQLRHTVRPGVTGWAQTRYRYGSSVEDAVEKMQYDLFYIKNMSLCLDIVILVDTVRSVVNLRGS